MSQTSQAQRANRGPALQAGAAVLAGGLLAWSASAAAAVPPTDIAALVEEVSPAVVNVYSTPSAEMVSERGGRAPFNLPEESPLREFFERFGKDFPQPGPHRGPGLAPSQGSGFIIDDDGYVVTNNHVIDGAKTVRIKLSDGRDFDAAVMGRDPKTDLALLKIDTDEALPFVEFGDSDEVKVGDWVVAIGNPFGLGGTVTTGIISARGRNINAGPYDDFLQTDAAINRGNSGGPMFNLDGEVIGVNTAIFSPSGGNVGIGFAIPANLAEEVIADLRDDGAVERGWLGVKIQRVTPEIAEAVGLSDTGGALVSEVTPEGPASAAELRQGDIILGFGGRDLARMRDLPRMTYRMFRRFE